MKRKLLALVVPALLAGCASTARVEEGVNKTDAIASKALESLRAGKQAEEKIVDVGVHRVEMNWIPMAMVSEGDYRAAAIVNRRVAVNRRIDTLSDAASYVTSLTGLPVSVAPGILPANIAQGISALPGVSATSMPGLPPPPQMTTPQAGSPAYTAMQLPPVISYNGKLSGLLDIVAAKFGVFWEPEADGVRFFKTKSRSFRLSALPGDSSMTSTIGTQTSGSSGASSATGNSGSSSSANTEQRSGIKFDGLSVWKAMEDSIKAMLSPDGRVVVTPATGTVTVDDTPPSLERVARFVNDQNVALTRQVVLNVRVLSVELTDSDSYGVNWNAIYKNIGHGVDVALNSASGLAAGSSTLAFNIVNTSSRWDGTQAMLEALSKQGKVSQITSASIVTINNQPAPIQIGRQRSYLASSTTTIGTAGSGNTTTLQPGIVTTGFSMSVLPHILDNGRLMLQYTGDISALVDISTVTSGDSSIQTPEVDTRNFLQRVLMSNGETLVLTGFEQVNMNGSKQGIGSPSNYALGGSVKNSTGRSVLVVLIQPLMTVGTN